MSPVAHQKEYWRRRIGVPNGKVLALGFSNVMQENNMHNSRIKEDVVGIKSMESVC